MHSRPIRRVWPSVGAGALMALSASGNSALAQLDLPSFYADPSRYILYNCPQLDLARQPGQAASFRRADHG